MKTSLWVGLILAVFALAAVLLLRTCVQVADETVGQLKSALGQVLQAQPNLTINNQVILAETKPISELAVVSKDELVSVTLNQKYEVLSWSVPLTQKTVTASATYRIKAGFDLKAGYNAQYDPATRHLVVLLPLPKILSVEKISDLTLQDASGYFNPTTDAERTQIIDSLQTTAGKTAQESGLTQEAADQVKARLAEILQAQAIQVEVRLVDHPTIN